MKMTNKKVLSGVALLMVLGMAGSAYAATDPSQLASELAAGTTSPSTQKEKKHEHAKHHKTKHENKKNDKKPY